MQALGGVVEGSVVQALGGGGVVEGSVGRL